MSDAHTCERAKPKVDAAKPKPEVLPYTPNPKPYALKCKHAVYPTIDSRPRPSRRTHRPYTLNPATNE